MPIYEYRCTAWRRKQSFQENRAWAHE